MVSAIGIANVVETKYIHWSLAVDDSTMMSMMMNIDFDRVVEQNSLMLMKVHENYFDVAMEENLLVVIRTNFNEKKIIDQ